MMNTRHHFAIVPFGDGRLSRLLAIVLAIAGTGFVAATQGEEQPAATDTATNDVNDNSPDAGRTSRPAKPPRVPDPREFAVSLDEHGRVPPFNFVGQPWPDVLQWLATLSECSLDWQVLPKDYLNLTTQQSYSVEEVRDLINRQLSARGYTILLRDKVMSVFEIDSLDPNLVPKVTEEELYDRGRYDFVKVSFGLPAGVSAVDLAGDVKEILSPNATVIPLVSSNRLLVMDTVANLCELTEIINGERAARDEHFREFVLRHVRANDVIDSLYEVLGEIADEAKSPQQLKREQERLKALSRLQRRGVNTEEMAGQQRMQGVRLVANRRRNSILANALPEHMRIIKRAVEAMDVPADSPVPMDGAAVVAGAKSVKKYPLKTTSVETMVHTLNDIGGLGPGAEVRGDATSRCLIVLANEDDHQRVSRLIERLDGAGRRFEVMPLRRLAADSVAATVYHLMVGQDSNAESVKSGNNNQSNQQQQPASPDAGFRVDADVENNRLLLWANDSELEEVRRLLGKLGEIPGPSDPQNVRVLGPFERAPSRDVLNQIQGVWSSFSDGELIINESNTEAADKQESPVTGPNDDDSAAGDVHSNEPDLQASGGKLNRPLARSRNNLAPAQFADLRVAAQTSATQAPLNVTVTDDGRVILNSHDPEALSSFEKLLKLYSPPEARFRVFRLEHARAYPVWLNLKEYFAEELGSDTAKPADGAKEPNTPLTLGRPTTGLSQRRKLHLIYDTPSNSILVANATQAQLSEIKELVDEYDRPAPATSIKARRTAAIKVHNSSAATIAAALKEVYRDLLSSRDKEFETEDAKLIGTASEAPTIIHYGVSDAESPIGKQTDPVKVRFDGSLSVGIDEAANMLIISAQEELFDSIVDTIHQLDDAVPQQTVAVHALRGNMSATALSSALSAAFDTPVKVHRSQSAAQQSSAQPQQTVVQPKAKKVRDAKPSEAATAADKGQSPSTSAGKEAAGGASSAKAAQRAGDKSAGSSE